MWLLGLVSYHEISKQTYHQGFTVRTHGPRELRHLFPYCFLSSYSLYWYSIEKLSHVRKMFYYPRAGKMRYEQIWICCLSHRVPSSRRGLALRRDQAGTESKSTRRAYSLVEAISDSNSSGLWMWGSAATNPQAHP